METRDAYGRLDNLRDCEDVVRGCLFMGTGGGGGVEWSMSMLTDALEDGLALELVDASGIPDDVWTVTPYGMGSIAPKSQETLDEMERQGLEDKLGDRSMEEAVKALGKHLGQPVGCIMPAELGAGQTPVPLVTGARLGIPDVDGDYARRAIPDEMRHPIPVRQAQLALCQRGPLG